MIRGYVQTRLKPITFFVLAALLALLALPIISFGDYLGGVLFMFYSFMVFRILDDAGSVHLDRKKHPERTYLLKENYKKFVAFVGIIIAIYFVLIAFIFPEYWLTVTVLLGGSVAGYLLLPKSTVGLGIIALMKYPVLLWCIIQLRTDASSLMLVSSTFFIVAAHDLLEEPNKASNYALGIAALLISGILIFQPWTIPYSAAFILPVLLVAVIFRRSGLISFFHIAYYPISYAILNYYL